MNLFQKQSRSDLSRFNSLSELGRKLEEDNKGILVTGVTNTSVVMKIKKKNSMQTFCLSSRSKKMGLDIIQYMLGLYTCSL